MTKKSTVWLIIIALIAVAGVAAALFWPTNRPSQAAIDAFAQCITAKGFTMYGAYWCPHCQSEKRTYGSSFKYIKYVECTENEKLCTDKGITGYPTWISGTGEKFEGELGLTKMAQISGCPAPTP